MNIRDKRKHSWQHAVTAVLLALVARHACPAEPTIAIDVDGHPVKAEVAATDDSRTRGLMFRTELARDAGMLFVYPESGYYAMWMKNTRIPLSVAFIDDQGRILNIEEMAPETLDPHASRGMAKYSLEMAGGWFARHGIQAGATVSGLGAAPKAQ